MLYGPGKIISEHSGLQITGNNIIIDGLTFTRANPTNATEIHYNPGISLRGDNLTIRNTEVSNMDGQGISVSGRNILIENCYSHNNITGVYLTGHSRFVKIINNKIENNNLVTDSGTDGILCSRTCVYISIINNDIINNGEHGVYFQGQKAQFIGNRILNNTQDGLKFGSYDTGGFVYDGEELDLWVTGSENIPGFNGVVGADGFGMSDIVIDSNVIENNRGGDGIYIQPSMRNCIIKNNHLKNNDIRTVYFNYSGNNIRLEDIYNIKIVDNILKGNNNETNLPVKITCQVYDGLEIRNNIIAGDISIYAQNSTTAPRFSATNNNCIIEGNKCVSINLSRYNTTTLKNNTFYNLSMNTNGDVVDLFHNTIINSGNIDIRRLRTVVNNNIKCFSMIGTGSGTIQLMSGNIIQCTKSDGISFQGQNASTNALVARYGKIIDNNFIYNWSSFVEAGSQTQNMIFSNNTLSTSYETTDNFPLNIRGFCCLVNGNILSSGSIIFYGSNNAAFNNIVTGTDISVNNGTNITKANNIIL